jgi:hypothetical protein
MTGILSGPVDGPARVAAAYPEVVASPGLRVVHRASGLRGTVVRLERDGVVLRTPTGGERVFRRVPGAFLVEGRAVGLVRPAPPPTAPPRSASGSLPAAAAPARVARASRIYVEGVHDAALLEKVWGDDLRAEGIVVERLDGLDDVAAAVRAFRPGPGRRLGILVDHLLPGTKEARLVAEVCHPQVLVAGTPFIDVWQAVRPAAAGVDAWPTVPPGQPWKEGVSAALGVADPRELWRRLLAGVSTYADLEPALVGAVESLLDFLTEEDG